MNDGATFNVSAGIVDICAWETKFNKRVSDWQHGSAISDLAFISWNYLKRTGATGFNYDQWLTNVDEIEQTEDVETPKATAAAH